MISVVAQASSAVGKSHKSRAAELLMRANKELTLGAFEMDWDTGQVVFRIGQIFPNHRYDETLIASLVHNAVAEVDRLTPFLGELLKTTPTMLPLLDITELLNREELLPPPLSEEESAEGGLLQSS